TPSSAPSPMCRAFISPPDFPAMACSRRQRSAAASPSLSSVDAIAHLTCLRSASTGSPPAARCWRRTSCDPLRGRRTGGRLRFPPDRTILPRFCPRLAMTLANGRAFLMIPGPTTVPDEVLRAMHRPAVDIYSGPLLDVTAHCLADLKRVVGTTGETRVYAATGHGGWEAALPDAR